MDLSVSEPSSLNPPFAMPVSAPASAIVEGPTREPVPTKLENAETPPIQTGSRAEATTQMEPNEASVVEKWALPREPEVSVMGDGCYAGRTVVSNGGSMARITPTILPSLSGGHRPDTIVDAGFVSDSIYVGAVSLRGPGHHHTGLARQDQYALGVEGDYFIGVVADGVSEGRYLSHRAADRAAAVAVTEVRKRIKSGEALDDWRAIGESCRMQVRALAEQILGGKMTDTNGDAVDVATVSDAILARSISTTCEVIVCKLTPDEKGDRPVVRATIAGDGCAYRLNPKRGWLQVGDGKMEQAGVASNAVVPLPVDPGPPRVTVTSLPVGEAFVLCTDGIGELIDQGERPVAQYLFREWARPLDTARLLNSASFVNINADDDRTAIIVWAVS